MTTRGRGTRPARPPGVAVALLLDRAGRDPAMGSGVLLTFTTDSMGFFISLGLASVFVLG